MSSSFEIKSLIWLIIILCGFYSCQKSEMESSNQFERYYGVIKNNNGECLSGIKLAINRMDRSVQTFDEISDTVMTDVNGIYDIQLEKTDKELFNIRQLDENISLYDTTNFPLIQPIFGILGKEIEDENEWNLLFCLTKALKIEVIKISSESRKCKISLLPDTPTISQWYTIENIDTTIYSEVCCIDSMYLSKTVENQNGNEIETEFLSIPFSQYGNNEIEIEY